MEHSSDDLRGQSRRPVRAASERYQCMKWNHYCQVATHGGLA